METTTCTKEKEERDKRSHVLGFTEEEQKVLKKDKLHTKF